MMPFHVDCLLLIGYVFGNKAITYGTIFSPSLVYLYSDDLYYAHRIFLT